MNNLSDLMNRATRDLVPESPDLVERGIARGIQQRRRMAVLATTTAVVATVVAVGGGIALAGGDTSQQPPVSTKSPQSSDRPSGPSPSAKPSEVTPGETLLTLKKLLPAGVTILRPELLGGHGSGINRVTMLVTDNGKAPTFLSVEVQRVPPNKDCAGLTECTVRKDGSVLVARETPLFPYDPGRNRDGIRTSQVELFRPDGTLIVLENLNAAAAEGEPRARSHPLLSPAVLTAIADSPEWRFPKKAPGWKGPDPLNPGTGKPAVPVSETQSIFRRALPAGLEVTDRSWAGSEPGENHASFLVNDGKGAALVHVKVTITTRDTRCSGEWWTTCTVRKDGSRLGYLDNQRSEGDGRMSQAQINYPDGRSITVTSYNTKEAYGTDPSRTEPVLSAEQLVTIASDPDWTFPGIPVK